MGRDRVLLFNSTMVLQSEVAKCLFFLLLFPYLLYSSGGWDSAGGVKVESTCGIPTFHPGKAPGRSRSFLGKSPPSSLSNGLKK